MMQNLPLEVLSHYLPNVSQSALHQTAKGFAPVPVARQRAYQLLKANFALPSFVMSKTPTSKSVIIRQVKARAGFYKVFYDDMGDMSFEYIAGDNVITTTAFVVWFFEKKSTQQYHEYILHSGTNVVHIYGMRRIQDGDTVKIQPFHVINPRGHVRELPIVYRSTACSQTHQYAATNLLHRLGRLIGQAKPPCPGLW